MLVLARMRDTGQLNAFVVVRMLLNWHVLRRRHFFMSSSFMLLVGKAILYRDVYLLPLLILKVVTDSPYNLSGDYWSQFRGRCSRKSL